LISAVASCLSSYDQAHACTEGKRWILEKLIQLVMAPSRRQLCGYQISCGLAAGFAFAQMPAVPLQIQNLNVDPVNHTFTFDVVNMSQQIATAWIIRTGTLTEGTSTTEETWFDRSSRNRLRCR